MKSPFISRIKIKNFRNFKEFDVCLSHKQVIIGENNIGKTNLIRAIQLILDPRLSDDDRQLIESDFFNGLNAPMANKEEIEIMIEIQGFEHNKTLLAVLSDATVSTDPPTLRFTYHYYPITREDGSTEYMFNVYQGIDSTKMFSHRQRKYFNIRVISALRDVESELKNSKKSPITQLLKEYDFNKRELEEIASNLKTQSNQLLSMDEIKDLAFNINSRFNKVMGFQPDSQLHLETMDFDSNRILTTLKLVIGQNKRATNETSMGLTNILYISLVLLSLRDNTVPSFLKSDHYQFLLTLDNPEILKKCYEETEKGNYKLITDISEEDSNTLYAFLDDSNQNPKGFTLLALEEPEAHLHPTLQRIIYKDVMKGSTSVLLTTHSPHITSVAPLDSFVHLRWTSNGTQVKTSSSTNLSPSEKQDLERYLDVKRGELYFGKGVILVEGIAEEYLIPKFAELMGLPLDLKGILVCNINSTNFAPYIKYLDTLGIPYVCITDGDYYINVPNPKKNDGSLMRKYHTIRDSDDDIHKNFGYLGNELVGEILIDLKKITSDVLDLEWSEQNKHFAEHGFFLGRYTLETEIMLKSNSNVSARNAIITTFEELTNGGDQQKSNFKAELEAGEYDACLRKIENSDNKIGKGRFAQRLSTKCLKVHIPGYVKSAIQKIYDKVDA
ncbi:DNA replication and repair protein RecF [Paenibacillus polymyxa E681]|uniref:ATP-dependent nuclease n=1 Tax=Paenibacillus polymyxa TaxID=1406 RepID=UPI0001E31AFD|nr:AAA family ATPase [Paenibacillus polymyxa]ADM71977.1 ATP-dependent endonuclease [Paenibacillus polymyxa E681]QNV59011.1 DNA replication and repair protein RecF [Paenibacillus polymyxa E681]QNV63837.1 DNA replication and repair protein RecF [Paenibacillus polymyxa E681]